MNGAYSKNNKTVGAADSLTVATAASAEVPKYNHEHLRENNMVLLMAWDMLEGSQAYILHHKSLMTPYSQGASETDVENAALDENGMAPDDELAAGPAAVHSAVDHFAAASFDAADGFRIPL